jgi:hypothetical protein
MKKHLNLVAIMLFLIALASFVAAVKFGHKGGGYGFSSGG